MSTRTMTVMNTNKAIGIVTLLLKADFNRCKLQVRTLQAFWKVSGVFCVCLCLPTACK